MTPGQMASTIAMVCSSHAACCGRGLPSVSTDFFQVGAPNIFRDAAGINVIIAYTPLAIPITPGAAALIMLRGTDLTIPDYNFDNLALTDASSPLSFAARNTKIVNTGAFSSGSAAYNLQALTLQKCTFANNNGA